MRPSSLLASWAHSPTKVLRKCPSVIRVPVQLQVAGDREAGGAMTLHKSNTLSKTQLQLRMVQEPFPGVHVVLSMGSQG